MIVSDEAAAEAAGLPVVARILAYGQIAGPDATLHERPADAIRMALKHAELSIADIDLFEINEAFAAVSLWSAKMLDLDLGQSERARRSRGSGPIRFGATGARLIVTLINALRERGGGRGAAALCGGGGQGDALIVEVG